MFERGGISSDNLQIMMHAHDSLPEIDTNFNGFDFLSVAPEGGLTKFEDEPEVESFIVPDPPGYLAVEDMADPFQLRSPEHMGRALRRGLSSKVQNYVAQREVIVRLRRVCVERIEQRGEVWAMMHSLSDFPSLYDD